MCIVCSGLYLYLYEAGIGDSFKEQWLILMCLSCLSACLYVNSVCVFVCVCLCVCACVSCTVYVYVV